MDNKAKWHCERHEGGWLIVAEKGLVYAYHLKADEMKNAHEPAFKFWQAVGSISRALKAVDALKQPRELVGLRAHLDTMLAGGWKITCRDPLCIACGDRSATVVEGMVIEHGAPVGMRRVGDVYERLGVSNG